MAEGARLESVFTRKGNVGSNPTLSAKLLITNNLTAVPRSPVYCPIGFSISDIQVHSPEIRADRPAMKSTRSCPTHICSQPFSQTSALSRSRPRVRVDADRTLGSMRRGD